MASSETALYVPLRKARVNLKIVDRKSWGASTAKDDLDELQDFPVGIVLVHYANVDPCKDNTSCAKQVKDLQTEHMKSGLDDIKWNFMIGGNGRVYEGRGWWFSGVKDLDLIEYDSRSLDIAFLCRPGENNVSRDMENALNELIKSSIVEGVLERFYELIGFKEDSHMVYVEEGVYKGFRGYLW